MNSFWIECLGWAATCVFVASYFFAKPSWLRGIQMLGALLWITYGMLIGAWPVIIANLLVFAAAAWTSFRKSPTLGPGSPA
jgi:inner membrane protein